MFPILDHVEVFQRLHNSRFLFRWAFRLFGTFRLWTVIVIPLNKAILLLYLRDIEGRYLQASLLQHALIDRGIHPPTIYFPLIVHEALMFEPTETESKQTLDQACDTILELLREAKADPAAFKQHPVKMPIGRPDEVTAARKPILVYTPASS